MESVGKPRHDRASNVLEVPDSWEEDGRMEEDGLIPTLVPLLGRRSPPTSDDSEPEPPATVARKVSFADTFGLNLVSVKEFDHWDLPIPLGPEPSESDPRDPEEYFLSCLFEVPSSADELARRLDEQKIELECVELLPGTTCLRGTVRVRNLCFGKMVYIRTTLDRWTTHFDLLADFVPGSSDGVTDRFTFRLTLVPPFESEGARVEFCIRYETELGTFWVNNGGANYVLFCNKRKRAEVKEKQGESRNKKGCLKTNSKNHSTEASPFALPTETPDQPEHSKGVVVGQTLESSVAKEEIQREDNRQNSLVDGNRIQSRRSRRWEARLARIRHHYAQREVEEKRVDVLAKVMGNKNTGASRVLSEISTPPSCVSSPPRTQDRSQTDIQGQMATYGSDSHPEPNKEDTLPLRLDVNDAPVSPQKEDTLPLRLDVNDAPVSLQKEDTLPLRLDSNDAPVSPQKADTLPLRLDANDAPVSPQKADTLPLRLDVNDAPVSPQKEGDGLEGESPEEIGSHLRAGGATQTAELEVIDLGSCLRDSGASLVETGRGPRDVIINGLLSPPGNTGQELPSERDPPRHSHANQEREPAGNDTSCREARPSVGHISHGCVFTFQTFVAPLYQEASRRDVPTLQDEDIVQGGEEDDEEMDDDGEMSCIGAAVAGTLQVCSEGLNELLVNREPNDQDPIDNKNKTATLSGQPEAERILKANIDRTEYDSNHEVGNGEDPLTTKAAELQTDFCEADTQIEDLTAAVEPLYTTVGHESVRGTETYDITFGEIPKEKNKEEEEMEDLLGDRPEAEEEETEETSKTEGEVLITTDEAITEEKEQNNFGEIGEIFNRDNKLDVSMRMVCPDEEHTLLGQEKNEKESEEEKKGKDDELMGWDTLSESEKERVSEKDTELQEEKKRKEKDEGISEIKEMSLEGLVCLNEVEKEEKDLFRVTKVHLNGTVKTFSRGRNEEDKDNKEEVLGEMEILSHGGEETTHLVEAEDLTERKFVFREEKYLNKEGKEDTGHILREEGVYFREEQEAFGGEISNDKSEGFFRVKQELLNVAKKEDTGDVLHEKVVHEHERKAMSTKEIHGLNGGNVKENEERVKKEEEESDDVFREKKIHQHERTGSIHVERGEDTNMRQHISMERNQYLIKEGEEVGGDTLGENKPNFSISQGQETLHGEGGERIDDGQQPVRVEEEEGLFREEKGASEDEEPDTTSTDSVTDDEMEAYVLTVKSLQGFSTAGIHRDQSASPTKKPSISRGPPASLSSIRESLNEEGDAESKTAPPLTAPAHPGESGNSTEVRLLVAEKVENVTEGDSSWWKDSFTFEHVSRVLLYGFLLAVFFLTAYYYDFLACFALYLFSVYWLFCHGDKQRLEGSD